MANGIRTGYPPPCGFNKGHSSKFCVGSQVWQTPEEGWRTYRPKRCGNNNKDEDNNPKTLNKSIKILNKSWKQHLTKQQLYGHFPPITKTMKVRWTRHVEHCWRSRGELINDVLLWTPSHEQRLDNQLEPTYSSSVLIWDVALKTYQKQWMIEKGVEKGSEISVLMARLDDDILLHHCVPINSC